MFGIFLFGGLEQLTVQWLLQKKRTFLSPPNLFGTLFVSTTALTDQLIFEIYVAFCFFFFYEFHSCWVRSGRDKNHKKNKLTKMMN